MPRRNLIAAALVALGSALCWQNSQGARPDDEMMELYGTFVDAVEQVQANYVRPVDRRELLENALKGMLAELDPHSSYFNDADWGRFQKQIEGTFTGIGVKLDIDRKTGRPVVIAPIVNSPAYNAGVLAGDQILEVDGESTADWTSDDVVENLTGRPGTDLTLTVLHPSTDGPVTLAIRRAVIELDSVMGDHRKPDDTWDFLLNDEEKVGYVRISSFIEDTADDLRDALDELKAEGMTALVLDLRDDPGGLLSAAVAVSDLFLEDGSIVTTRGRNSPEKQYEAEVPGTYSDFPMAVLINDHSASASEIVAAALQDHERAKIVGQRSFGKGSVQNILNLDDGTSKLKLTVATYWRPSGKNIHRFPDSKPEDEWGVSPDDGLEVVLDDDQYVEWAQDRQERDLISRANRPRDPDADPLDHDPQLRKALEVVREEPVAEPTAPSDEKSEANPAEAEPKPEDDDPDLCTF